MKTYDVTVSFDCSRSITITANSPEDATQKAYGETANLCHQCANQLSVGDAIRVTVCESGKEVANDDHNQQVIADLVQQRDKLLMVLEQISRLPDVRSDEACTMAQGVIDEVRGENRKETTS